MIKTCLRRLVHIHLHEAVPAVSYCTVPAVSARRGAARAVRARRPAPSSCSGKEFRGEQKKPPRGATGRLIRRVADNRRPATMDSDSAVRYNGGVTRIQWPLFALAIALEFFSGEKRPTSPRADATFNADFSFINIVAAKSGGSINHVNKERGYGSKEF